MPPWLPRLHGQRRNSAVKKILTGSYLMTRKNCAVLVGTKMSW